MSNFPQILADRYEIQKILASKGGRKTVLAVDRQTQELVVIKLLTFGDDLSWEDLKLFEREAETLKSLEHTAIPKYLDYFELSSDTSKGFALVQTYIDAPSLEEQLETGRSFSEEEVKQLAKSILEILDYLHSRQPAIIHRDIKPSNILLSNRSGNNVGDVYLVDFGSVQNLATKKGSTITVVGTYGYMPPEQFGGRAKPASDLYSLGATLIYLVTGQHPADLPETDLKIEFKQLVNISPGLANYLEKMTQPSLSKRIGCATEAIELLENCHLQQNQTAQKVQQISINKPNDSNIVFQKTERVLGIIIPPAGLFSPITLRNVIFLTLLSLFVPLLPRFFIDTSHNRVALEGMQLDYAVWLLKSIGYIFSFLITGGIVTFFLKVCLGVFGQMQLRIDSKRIYLVYKLFGIQRHSPLPGLRKDIYRLEKCQTGFRNKSYLKIWVGKLKYELSNNPHFPLNNAETNWLAWELSNWLNLSIIETNQIDKN